MKWVSYRYNELEDGTIALTGYPVNISEYSGLGPQGNVTMTKRSGGPIINIFIKSQNCNFGVLYRDAVSSDEAGNCGTILSTPAAAAGAAFNPPGP